MPAGTRLLMAAAGTLAAAQGGGEAPEGYWGEVFADDPLHHWRLTETSGSVAEDAIGSFDLSIQNAPLSGGGASLVGQDGDGSREFTSSGSQKYPNGSADLTGDTLVLEAWTQASSFADTIKCVAGFDNTANFFILRVGDGGGNTAQVSIRASIGGSSSDLVGPSISPDEPHHLVAAYDGSTLKLYIDGVEEASEARSGTVLNGAGWFYIGTSNSYWPMAGQVDEVALYRELSPERIAAHYVAGGGVLDEGGGGFEFIGASSAQQVNNNTPLPIPVIAGVEEGDTLVVFTTAVNDPEHTPAGETWTTVDQRMWGDAGQRVGVFTRLVTASEPASNYDFFNDWTNKQVGVAVAYRGSYEVHVVGDWAFGGGLTGGTREANAITTTEDAIIIAVQDQYPFTGQTPTSHAATGMVRRIYQENNGGMPSIAFLYDSDAIMPAGSYDTTITGSPSIGPCVLLFALTPA